MKRRNRDTIMVEDLEEIDTIIVEVFNTDPSVFERVKN